MNPARNLRGQLGCELLSIGTGTREVLRRTAERRPGAGGRSRGDGSGRDGGPEASQETSNETCRIIAGSPAAGAADRGVAGGVVACGECTAVGGSLVVEFLDADAGDVVGDRGVHWGPPSSSKGPTPAV